MVVGEFESVLIGDFLHRIRRPIDLLDGEKYRLVTVKMNHKSVVLREKKLGSLIKSKMYTVKEGDFILSGIDVLFLPSFFPDDGDNINGWVPFMRGC